MDNLKKPDKDIKDINDNWERLYNETINLCYDYNNNQWFYCDNTIKDTMLIYPEFYKKSKK